MQNLRVECLAAEQTKGPRLHQELRKVGGAALIGLVVAIGAVLSPRASVAKAASEPAPTIDQLTPVPMPEELPPATSPNRQPLSYAAHNFGVSGPRITLWPDQEQSIVTRARHEIDLVDTYDSSWMQTSGYPMGDVPERRGACTDVVVRSLREIGVDLQELVHEDVMRDMGAYGVTAADTNIDHRRIGTMFTFMTRNAMPLTLNVHDKKAWRPGDIVFVAWSFKKGAAPEHVGIISDRIGARGVPMVIENGGPRPVESDSLGKGKVVGHFRAMKKREE